MKLSRKLALSFAAVLTLFALTLIIFNSLFLNKFYAYQKRRTLNGAFTEITEYVQTTTETGGDFYLELTDKAQNYNVRAYYFDKDGISQDVFPRFRSIADLRLVDQDGNVLDTPQEYACISTSGQQIEYKDISLGEDKSDEEAIAMIGQITDSNDKTIGFLFLYTNYKSIQESTNIFNVYTLYVSLVILAISLVLVSLLSNRLTKPLYEVKQKARRIANLDFSDKIPINSHDEIGELAISINKMSDELENNINDLKAANAKLQEDLMLKEQINSMRKQFISDVSHELKTPISIIGGYAEALKMGCLSEEEINEYSDIILDETIKMNKLVRDLLKYTQIEQGFMQLEEEEFSILDVINGVVKPNELKINERKIKLSIDVKETIVLGDHDLTETVFQNFFNNALNHVSEEGEIKVYSKKMNKDKLRIYVYNTGETISEENQKRIWESFYKVDKARTRSYGGTGLGLSIVKTIMDAYKNKYGVANKEDGVEFYFDVNILKTKESKENE